MLKSALQKENENDPKRNTTTREGTETVRVVVIRNGHSDKRNIPLPRHLTLSQNQTEMLLFFHCLTELHASRVGTRVFPQCFVKI